MKKFAKLMLSAALAATALLAGCDPDPDVIETPDNPTIAIDGVQEGLTKAVVTVSVTFTDKVCYTYYAKGARPAEITWQEKAVTADGKVNIEFDVTPLDDVDTYTFEAYASRVVKEKEYVSANVTKDFALLPNPIVVINSIEPSVSSAVASLNVEDADAIYYIAYAKNARPATPEWTKKDITADGETTVEVSVTPVEGAESYTFEVYAERTDDEVYKSTSATLDFALIAPPAITINSVDESSTKAVFHLTVAKAANIYYAYYAKDARPENVEYTEQAIEADGDIDVTLELPANFEARTTYTFEVYGKRIENDVDIVSEPVTKNFQTVKAEYVTISNIFGAPGKISMDISYMDEYVDGYAIQIWEKGSEDWSVEVFTAMLGSEEGAGMYEVYSNNFYKSDNGIKPGTEYVIAYAGVKKGTIEGWFGPIVYAKEVIGGVQTKEVTTAHYQVGQCDASVTLDEPTTDYFSIRSKANRVGDTEDVYIGLVSKAELGDTPLNDYINSWFVKPTEWGGFNYDNVYPDSFWNEYGGEDMLGAYTESIDIYRGSLNASTEYVLFAVAYNKRGELGQVASVTATTKTLEFNSAANVTLTPTVAENGKSVTFAVVYNDGCVKFKYLNETPYYSYTEADVIKSLTGDSANICEAAELTQSWLDKNKNYKLHVLPIDAEGKYGKLQTITYNTNVPDVEFNGDAVIGSVTVSEVAFTTGTYPRPYYTVNITKGDGCDGYYWYSAGCSTFTQSGNTVEAQARKALDMYGAFLTENLVDEQISIYGEDSYLFVIPYKEVEGKKVYGTPTRKLLINETAPAAE